MKSGMLRFNIYLLAALLLATAGCKSSEERRIAKDTGTIRVHLQVNRTGSDREMEVPIFRKHPVLVNVQKIPFLDERDLVSAAVIQDVGGFAIRLLFEHQGSLLLENVTSANPGGRLALQCQFSYRDEDGEKIEESRWLGAPSIDRRTTDGTLVFTPDCTRDEAQRIVRGLNNVVKKMKR